MNQALCSRCRSGVWRQAGLLHAATLTCPSFTSPTTWGREIHRAKTVRVQSIFNGWLGPQDVTGCAVGSKDSVGLVRPREGSGELDWHHRRMAQEARLLGSTNMITFELSDLEKLGEDNLGLGGHSDI